MTPRTSASPRAAAAPFAMPSADDRMSAVSEGAAACDRWPAVFARWAVRQAAPQVVINGLDPLLLEIVLGAAQSPRWLPLVRQHYAELQQRGDPGIGSRHFGDVRDVRDRHARHRRTVQDRAPCRGCGDEPEADLFVEDGRARRTGNRRLRELGVQVSDELTNEIRGTGNFIQSAGRTVRDTTGHRFRNLNHATPYSYRLRAVKALGAGAASNETSATPTRPGVLVTPWEDAGVEAGTSMSVSDASSAS